MEFARLASLKKKRRLRLFSDERVCSLDDNIEPDKCLLVKTVAGEEMIVASAVHRESSRVIIQTTDGRMFAEKDVIGCVGVVYNPALEDNVSDAVGQGSTTEAE